MCVCVRVCVVTKCVFFVCHQHDEQCATFDVICVNHIWHKYCDLQQYVELDRITIMCMQIILFSGFTLYHSCMLNHCMTIGAREYSAFSCMMFSHICAYVWHSNMHICITDE